LILDKQFIVYSGAYALFVIISASGWSQLCLVYLCLTYPR